MLQPQGKKRSFEHLEEKNVAIKEHLEALFSKEGMISPIQVGIHLGAILLKGI